MKDLFKKPSLLQLASCRNCKLTEWPLHENESLPREFSEETLEQLVFLTHKNNLS